MRRFLKRWLTRTVLKVAAIHGKLPTSPGAPNPFVLRVNLVPRGRHYGFHPGGGAK